MTQPDQLTTDRGALRGWQSLLPALAMAALTPLVMPFDLPLARWALQGGCPHFFQKLLNLSEVFGHGIGVGMILLVLFWLAPAGRVALPRIVLCTLTGGLGADLAKLLVLRYRPYEFLAKHAADGGVWATFGDWLPGIGGDSATQSFPSAHTATAVALACALSWFYPQGRRVFGVLAVLVACQRIVNRDHYLSDCVGGAAIGLLAGACFFRFGWLPGWFDRLESRLRRGSQSKTGTTSAGS